MRSAVGTHQDFWSVARNEQVPPHFWSLRYHPNASGGVKAGIFALLSDRFQVNIRQTSIRLGGGFVLRLLDALNLRDCWASSAGKFHAHMICFLDPEV